MPAHYPEGTVRALLPTDQVTEATRNALTERLTASPRQPAHFSDSEFALLQAICDRLIPQDDRPEYIDLAGNIDNRLSQNKSDGWRYDTMPPDGDAYKQGLAGVDQTAQLLFEQPFRQLPAERQDDVLKQIQQGQPAGEIWTTLPAGRFFEELLVETTESYYMHPLAQEEIGYVGMADVPTWQRIGLNQLEDREPKETKNTD